MDEIVEGTVGTLHILAREAQSRSSIRAMKCMPLFVQVRRLPFLYLFYFFAFCFFVALKILLNVIVDILTQSLIAPSRGPSCPEIPDIPEISKMS